MYWLILYYTSVIVLPEKYPTEEACHKAAEVWVVPKQHACIPAPKIEYNCTTTKSNGDGTYSAVPSICNPPINNMPKCVTNINSGKLECN